ncbi:MAG TPA: hypothetical protein VG248_11805 [Caulobacteraceae bacterium]|nr:hypothetical protein [Caulobacteraceae bacterium]
MRPILSSLVAAAAAIACAQAQGAPQRDAADTGRVRAAIGNTIVETYPDGRQAEIWLKADGSYTGEGRRHDMSNGTWSVKGEQICFRQQHPSVPFGFGHLCRDIPEVSIGQSWTSKAATGEPVKVRLARGHVVPS